MALTTRSAIALGLLFGGTFVLAAGCGSSDKKAATPEGGGEAGAVTAAAGADASAGQASGGFNSRAGAGGEPGGAGDGGASSGVGGTAPVNQAGTSSMGGIPAVDCTPAGATVGLTFDSKNTFVVCRGALALLNFSVDSSDQRFVCCGTSSGAYGFEGHGLAANDGGGELTYFVPDAAPLGAQTLSVSCASGAIATPVAIDITLAAPPVVDSITAAVPPNGKLTIVGSNLIGVNRVRALSVDPAGKQLYCTVESQTATDEKVTCSLAGDTPPGQYVLSAFTDNCGAVNSPTFDVIDG